jgi:hypothetical protein
MKKRLITERNISVVRFENNKVPEFKEARGKDWIMFGEKNDYPDYLLSLFNRSAKHNAIITGKSHYIKGNGFTWERGQLTPEQQINLETWLKNINPYDTVNDLLFKVAVDYEVFNGFALQVIPNKIGTGISEIHHLDFSKLRIHKDKNKILYSRDWTKSRQSFQDTGLLCLEPFNPKTYSGIVYFKSYRPGTNVYPLPEYIGCISYIETDAEISNFHLNNIKNGFSGGTLISFNNGVPETDEQQRAIENKMKKKTTGSDQAGQLIICFSDNKDTAPTISPLLPNNFDKLFDNLNQTVQQEIFTGHKITSPMLFGIKEAGQLGGRDELREAFELFQNGYIQSKQKVIADVFNDLAECSGHGRRLSIVPTEPISEGFSEQTLVSVMTPDEIREKAGLRPLQQAQKPIMAHSHFSDVFASFGRSKNDYEILSNSQVESKEDVLVGEIAFYKSKFKKPDISLDSLSRSILDLVSKNNLIQPEEIAKLVKKPLNDVLNKLKGLLKGGLVKGDIGKDLEIQPEAENILEENPAATENIEIMYSYEVRSGLGPDLLPTSRPFCKKLIEMDKLYTREDIENISKLTGRDVWTDRGGYYHNPKTDETTPYCRHVWNQNIVRRK